MRLKSDELTAMMYMEFGNLLLEFDCHEDAARFLARSLELSEKTGNRHGMRRTLQSLGKVLLRNGNFIMAEILFKRCLEMHTEENPGYDLFPLLGLIDLYRFTGRYSEAEKRIDEAKEKIDSMQVLEPYLLTAESGILIETGKYREAIGVIDHALGLCSESRGEVWIELLSRKAWCHAKLGEMETARKLFDNAVSFAGDKGVPYRESATLSLKAISEIEADCVEEARSSARMALDKALAVESDLCLTLALEAMGRVESAAGKKTEAPDYSRNSLLVARKIKQHADSCASTLSLARMYADEGNFEDAMLYAYRVLHNADSRLHPVRKESMLILARAFEHQRLPKEAAGLAKSVLDWCETSGDVRLRSEAENLLSRIG